MKKKIHSNYMDFMEEALTKILEMRKLKLTITKNHITTDIHLTKKEDTVAFFQSFF